MLDPVRAALASVLKVELEPPPAPAGDHVEVFRASEKHRTYLFAAFVAKAVFAILPGLLTMVGAGIAVLVTQDGPAWAGVLLIAFGLVFFTALLAVEWLKVRIDWETRWYVVTDRAIRIREGVMMRRELTLTMQNIQDLKITQGPIQRLLGIADISVETAGGGGAASDGVSVHGHAGVLRGIDDARGLREKLQERLRRQRGAGLGDHDDDHGALGEDQAARPSTLHEALLAVRDEARALRQTWEAR